MKDDILKKTQETFEKFISSEVTSGFFKHLKIQISKINTIAKEYGWLILCSLLFIQVITENSRLNGIQNEVTSIYYSINTSSREQTELLYHIDSSLCSIRNNQH